jgi:HSP20 family protein
MRFDPFRDLDRSRPMTMPMDAYRQGDRFIVHFDLPGVDPSSIDLTVEKNVLTVRGERGWEPTEGQEVLINERPQGTFTRQLFLGETLDTDGIEATYRNGVLTLAIPVAEQAKPRRVEIRTQDGESAPIESSSRVSGEGDVSGTQQPAETPA